MNNAINNPPHYQGASPIGAYLLLNYFSVTDEQLDMECIDFLEANPRYCNFHLGNAIKYLWRCGNKGDAIEDLKKALWYLQRWKSRHNFNFIFLAAFGGNIFRKTVIANVSKLIQALEEELNP